MADPKLLPEGSRIWSSYPLSSDGYRESTTVSFEYHGKAYHPGPARHWGILPELLARVGRAGRLLSEAGQVRQKYFFEDYPVLPLGSHWDDVGGAVGKIYVVQTTPRIIERCMLMSTDPGDLVLDPTCGSGTTALVAEKRGRRWITIDTSRVALALARQRLMTAEFPYYILKDSLEGTQNEAELNRRPPREGPFRKDIRQGFVYARVPHITLKSIANNAEIDVIHERWQRELEALREALSRALGEAWEEWEIPREASDGWSAEAKDLHAKWWEGRRARQAEIDASIAKNAETEYLYDRPYEQKGIVRVTGPFTVESLSPHRVLPADEEDAAWEEMLREEAAEYGHELPPRRRLEKPNEPEKPSNGEDDFVRVVLENLKRPAVP